MFRVFIFVLVYCSSVICATGQTVRIVNSSSQKWSGGIAGHSGTNYYFEVEFSGFRGEPLPETLWLGKEPVAQSIIDSADGQSGNTIRAHKRGVLLYKISAGTQKDEYNDRYPDPENKKSDTPVHVPVYKGVALLSYRYHGKRHRFEIMYIMKNLATADYP